MLTSQNISERIDSTDFDTQPLKVAEIAELMDGEAALKYTYLYKGRSKLICPRCDSAFTRKINSGVFRELSRCIDCSYMFNCLAGTLFQGTKISMHRFLQAIVVFDHSQPSERAKDISYHIDVSMKTARSLVKMLRPFENVPGYSQRTVTPLGHGLHDESEKNHKFINYCDRKKLLIYRESFFAKIHLMLDTRTKDIDAET